MKSTTIRMLIAEADLALQKNNPILFAGFPGAGLVGSICTSYLIEKLKMKHIACVDSQYIYPGVVYAERKLRHPFRIYVNDARNILVLVCEAPVILDGIHSVLDAVIDWTAKNYINEVVVMDGIPMQGMPDLQNRKPFILSSRSIEDDKTTEMNDYHGVNNGESSKTTTTIAANPSDGQSKQNRPAKNFHTFIGGIAGGILASCLSHRLSCSALLVPSLSGIPDPEGASILIDLYNEFVQDKSLKVNSGELAEQGEILKKQLEEVMKATLGQSNTNGSIPKKMIAYG